ncbi:MAG: hypothetical protein GX100_12230 [candidate division WS1 bacterium]|nr:hypothetical protein [candidate division WS1 bacterium]
MRVRLLPGADYHTTTMATILAAAPGDPGILERKSRPGVDSPDMQI